MIKKESILKARKELGLTQTQASALIHCTLRAWQQWEAGDRQMHKAFWELFLIKCGLPLDYESSNIDETQQERS